MLFNLFWRELCCRHRSYFAYIGICITGFPSSVWRMRHKKKAHLGSLSECCGMNVLFLSVSVDMFDSAIVLVKKFFPFSIAFLLRSSFNNCPRLRHDTYQHPGCNRFSNLNSNNLAIVNAVVHINVTFINPNRLCN